MHNSPPFALSRVGTRARRIAGMGLAEIGGRTRQASAKWIERLRFGGRPLDPSEALRRHAPALADPRAALQILSDSMPLRFFGGATGPADAHRTTLPSLRPAADRLLTKHFDLLGYRRLWFGDPIDWHLDPVHATRAPLAHWSAIDPLDPAAVGDSKIVWELNRHQWLVRLAQARVASGDERYAAAALAAIDDWIAANPPGYGINWVSSLEVALRLMSWTWVLVLLRDSRMLTGNTLTGVLASLHAHASHVQTYLSTYYSPNTHLTGEALGLFYAGTVFAEFHDAGEWRRIGAATLIEQADKQIADDGVYFEQSTCYQRYTCEIYLHFVVLAARNGIPLPERTRQHLPRLVDVLLALRRPDGGVPPIGDADGGWLMPLTTRGPEDCRGVFAAAAAWLERPDLAAAAGDLAPEVVWLLGEEGIGRFTTAARDAGGVTDTQIFPAGGYAVMRSGPGRDAHQLIADAGPLGCYGHGHADLLSIQCSIFGDRCLVDAGTCGYTTEPEWRDYFRSTAAHNTVTVDGLGQAEPSGPFGWRQRPRATVREWRSTGAFDFLDAEHDAFVAQGLPVVHRRRILFVKPDFWILIDDVTGDGMHTVEWSFQFAPLPVSMASDRSARADTERGRALWIVPVSTAGIHAAIACGATSPIRGWVSPDYGQRRPAPMLMYASTTALPARLVTVLYPERTPSASAPAVRALLDDAGRLAGVHVVPSATAVRFDGPSPLIERG